jgi:hypothetical protein
VGGGGGGGGRGERGCPWLWGRGRGKVRGCYTYINWKTIQGSDFRLLIISSYLEGRGKGG